MTGLSRFDFYPRDWFLDTRDLSDRAKGCYIDLLAGIYNRGGPLPYDENDLCRLCGYKNVRSLRLVLGELIEKGKFTVEEITTDGAAGKVLVNNRACEEIAQAHADISNGAKAKSAKTTAKRGRNGAGMEPERGPNKAGMGSVSTPNQAENGTGNEQNQRSSVDPPSPSPSPSPSLPPLTGRGDLGETDAAAGEAGRAPPSVPEWPLRAFDAALGSLDCGVSCFRPLMKIAYQDGVLTVQAATQSAFDALAGNYDDLAANLAGQNISIEIVCERTGRKRGPEQEARTGEARTGKTMEPDAAEADEAGDEDLLDIPPFLQRGPDNQTLSERVTGGGADGREH